MYKMCKRIVAVFVKAVFTRARVLQMVSPRYQAVFVEVVVLL